METNIRKVKLAFKAWGIGLLSAGLVFLPLAQVWGSNDVNNPILDIVMRVVIFVLSIPHSVLMAVTFGLLLSAPLFLIALIFALTFSQLAARNPKKTSGLAIILTVLIIAGTETISRDNRWAASHSFWEKFSHISLTWDTWIFAFPVGVASYYYCFELRRLTALMDEKVEKIRQA
jgi:hypothetical protein